MYQSFDARIFCRFQILFFEKRAIGSNPKLKNKSCIFERSKRCQFIGAKEPLHSPQVKFLKIYLKIKDAKK